MCFALAAAVVALMRMWRTAAAAATQKPQKKYWPQPVLTQLRLVLAVLL